MKEGPPTASAVASSSSLIISNPMALEIAEEEGGEAVISLLPEVQAPSKRPIAVTTTSTATVMTTKTSDVRGFQSTDTVKRLRKLCRDFYREATDACLFIDQQAYADKERWSNEPPYVILCQNYVGRCVKDINDRVCMLAEKVERLETELDSLVIPVNKMVFSNPHPFDGHSQRRVVNALERWRLVQNDSFFRFHFSSKEFAHVSNDLTEKNKQLEAKLRHELKKTTSVAGGSGEGTSSGLGEKEGSVEEGSSTPARAVPLPRASGATKTTGIVCLNYPQYVNKVLQLLGRVGKLGESFQAFELSQFSKLKGALEKRHGQEWLIRFEVFLQDAYKSYQSIFSPEAKMSSFGCKNEEEDAKQHMANFRFCFQSKFGEFPLL